MCNMENLPVVKGGESVPIYVCKNLILTLSRLDLSPLVEEMIRCNLLGNRSGCGTTLTYAVAPHYKCQCLVQ
jgi:hypothetical protein